VSPATAESKTLPQSAGLGAAADEHSDDAATSVVSMYVKQQKIYARAVSGWFAGWRWAMVWATQLVFYGLPWLQWNDRQAVLFDLGARRFYMFGMVNGGKTNVMPAQGRLLTPAQIHVLGAYVWNLSQARKVVAAAP